MLSDAVAVKHPDLANCRFTPHDFRRLFATDLVNHVLPIHIGAALLGHLDVQTTHGYVTVFQGDVIRHYQAHLARRCAARLPGNTGRRPPRNLSGRATDDLFWGLAADLIGTGLVEISPFLALVPVARQEVALPAYRRFTGPPISNSRTSASGLDVPEVSLG
jgi:hypothetical protein